jgi:uncharacterized repeat protein (TIGR01451 family)
MGLVGHTGCDGAGRRAPRRLLTIAACTLAVLTVPGTASAATASDLTVGVSSSASGSLHVGDVFSYTVTVTNGGSAVAHDVEIGDDLPAGLQPKTILPTLPGGNCSVASSQGPTGPPHHSVFCTRPSLDAGVSVSVLFEVKVTGDATCGDLVNTPHVRASDEPAAARGNNTGSVTDTVACPPSIALTKQMPAFAHVGDTVNLAIGVTNDGGIDLENVHVGDPGCSGALRLVADGDGDAILSPGETWRYRCGHRVTRAAGDRFSSLAIATATSANGPVRATDGATARVVRPELTLHVIPRPVSGTPGDTVTYRFVLHNGGNATVSDISIDDDQLGHIGDVAQLVPGHTVTLTIDRVLSARHVWVVDEATATGADPSGATVTATDRAAVTIIAPTGSGPAPRGGDGAAFTGSAVTAPLVAGIVLGLLGAAALILARRRHA